MVAMSPWRSRAARLLLVTTALLGLLTFAPAPRAEAAGVTSRVGVAAVSYAAAVKGKPYVRGGASPSRGFDCSGLVTYVFNTRLHRRVPRTADAQYRAAVKLPKSKMRKGDLVFFLSRGRAYHVGIYAGSNRMWHAPKPGARVKLVPIWTTQWVGGRVR